MMNWFTQAMAWDLRTKANIFTKPLLGGGRRSQTSSPDLWAAVLEKLQKLWDHDVERSVQSVAVQQLG